MNKTAKKGRGDDDYRLLSYLKQYFKEPIVKMVPIRDSIFLINTPKNTYVIKGYSKYKKLKLQETFTATLKQEGFNKTYTFLPHLLKEQPFFKGKYYGCMEYLQPHVQTFSYDSHGNRKEGLKLLDEFHAVTAFLVNRYQTLIPFSDILEKWAERLNIFAKNRSKISRFLNEKYIIELLEWSKWSLKGMAENENFWIKKPYVILHGDVAHHNFLRDRSGTLHLIDFDLIAIGPACLDFLQYANRILPHLDWSLEKLGQYKQIARYFHEPAFLHALAFPTDILREWNRILREKKSVYSDQVIDLTLEQFHLRHKFVEELKRAVKG